MAVRLNGADPYQVHRASQQMHRLLAFYQARKHGFACFVCAALSCVAQVHKNAIVHRIGGLQAVRLY
jgi:hypothetical protein